MSKPITWTNLFIESLCQLTATKWNDLVRWLAGAEVTSLIINETKAQIKKTANGTLISMVLPTGGGDQKRCKSFYAELGSTPGGSPAICVNRGIVKIGSPQSTTNNGASLPYANPGASPQYNTHQIELTVNTGSPGGTNQGVKWDADNNPICISPFDAETDCLWLKLEVRGGDEGVDPLNEPFTVVRAGEIVDLVIEKHPCASPPQEVQCSPAEYTLLEGAEEPVITVDEVNGVFYWPFWDGRLDDPQVMCNNMELFSCGGCIHQLYSLAGNAFVAEEVLPTDGTFTLTCENGVCSLTP